MYDICRSRDDGRRRVERARARALDDKSSSRTVRPEKPQPEEYIRVLVYIPINIRDIITTLRHTHTHTPI